MSFFFGRGKGKGIPQNATFRITQEGREKLQQFNGDTKTKILAVLETEGSMDIDEISRSAGMSKGQVERQMPLLVRGKYAQYIGSAEVE